MSWIAVRPHGYTFKDENRRAGGLPRRPREPSQGTRNLFQSVPGRSVAITNATWPNQIPPPSTEHCHYRTLVESSRALSQTSLPPYSSLASVVFANFAQNYLDAKHDTRGCYWSHVRKYRLHWESAKIQSILGVAATALSFAIFGRTRASRAALQISFQTYNVA